MSGTAPRRVVGRAVLGYGGYNAPFTAVQGQELEQQVMIFKYLAAGLPIPPDLVMRIRRSFDKVSTSFAHNPALGCFSHNGKKSDPEPGRCRRNDGKKWRCPNEAYPESKICKQHMYQRRYRSRKPVESQPTLQCSVSSEGSSSWSNVTKLQMGPISYGIDHRRFSFIRTPDFDEHCFSQEASGRVGRLGLGSSTGSQVSTISNQELQKTPRVFEHINSSLSKQKQDSFFGSDIGSPSPVKQGQHPVHHFFSERPSTKESRTNLDYDRSNLNVFTSTQLSISIPRASAYKW